MEKYKRDHRRSEIRIQARQTFGGSRFRWRADKPARAAGPISHGMMADRFDPVTIGIAEERRVIACDKRKAFAQGSGATKQSILP